MSTLAPVTPAPGEYPTLAPAPMTHAPGDYFTPAPGEYPALAPVTPAPVINESEIPMGSCARSADAIQRGCHARDTGPSGRTFLCEFSC